MSFEPTIIIDKESLETVRAKIEKEEWTREPAKPSQKYLDKRKAYEVLRYALGHKGIELRGIKFVILQPDGSVHNENVRSLLSDLGVAYAIDC